MKKIMVMIVLLSMLCSLPACSVETYDDGYGVVFLVVYIKEAILC